MTERLRRWLKAGPLTTANAIKAVAFGLLLLYVQFSHFGAWPVIVFVGFALVAYVQPAVNGGALFTSLIALLTLSLLVTSRFVIVFSDPALASRLPTGIALFSIGFAFLFYILLGIKNLLFVHRREWHYVLYLLLFYFICSVFFSAGFITAFGWKLLAFFAGAVLLVREFLKFQEHTHNRLVALCSWIAAFIVTQAAWALSLLPLSFSMAASLMIVLIYTISEVLSRYLHNTLTARFLRWSSFAFVALFVIISLMAQWRL